MATITRRERREIEVSIFNRLSAPRTSDLPKTSVKLDDLPASCQLVETIDVLGDKGEIRRNFFQGGQCFMRPVWPFFRNDLAPPMIPFPDEFGLCLEGLRGGEFFGFEIFPEASLSPKSGDAAVGGDSSAGEDRD